MKTLLITLILLSSAFGVPLRRGEHLKIRIQNEYIIKTDQLKSGMQFLESISSEYVLVNATLEQISSLSEEDIIYNYKYIGNFMESMPNDLLFAEQFHLKQIHMPLVWDMGIPSNSLIIAVTDNEFELDHDDLRGQWHVNRNEIEDNNKDDDNNGYVDDVMGWDFIAGDNDVDPAESPTHGTHVSGIIAASTNNGLGIASIAPNVKIMPLRWYGDEGSWTSAIVAKTYFYAVDNGAKIISTSYNIDPLVEDKIYLKAIEHAVLNDVLIFNSAGNDRTKNSPREKIEDIILVCSVQSKDNRKVDRKSRFSNYGEGVDICAPGDPIFSTVQRRYEGNSRYAELEGTSMSAPLVAAVAALIWTKFPEMTASEVKKRLLDSADNIDEQNSRYKGMLGSGRINAYRALFD
jgi:subtilisin family serine protease